MFSSGLTAFFFDPEFSIRVCLVGFGGDSPKLQRDFQNFGRGTKSFQAEAHVLGHEL